MTTVIYGQMNEKKIFITTDGYVLTYSCEDAGQIK